MKLKLLCDQLLIFFISLNLLIDEQYFVLPSDCVFVILYIYMSELWISPKQLLIASSLLTVGGYLCNIVITGHSRDISTQIWTCK